MRSVRRRLAPLVTAALLAVALQFGALPARADTINVSTWGNITSTGNASSCCYNIGYNQSNGPEYRDFFEFNLSSITPGTAIYGLTLSIFEPAYSSVTSSVSLDVGSYGSSTSYLTSSGTNAETAFTALGSGTVYGSAVDTSANDGTFLRISLSDAAAAAMESLEGTSTPFVIGGYVVGLSSAQANSIFQYSGSSGSVHLSYSEVPVPEPASLGLLGAGLAGLRFIRRRKQTSRA